MLSKLAKCYRSALKSGEDLTLQAATISGCSLHMLSSLQDIRQDACF